MTIRAGARGLALAACLTALVGSTACERRASPELLVLREIAPTEIGVGDRVDVFGVDLPSGDVHEAHVIFRGALYRPGKAPLENQVIEVEGAQVSPDRVGFTLSDAVAASFTGGGEEAVHTTFRGTVEVSVPNAAGATPVRGRLKGTSVLEVVPRAPRRAIAEERDREAREALDFLGLELDEAEGHGPVEVASVRDGSPAARAGIAAHDRIEGFDGMTVLAATDVVPSGLARASTIDVVRGDDRERKSVDMEGYRSDATGDLVGAVVVLGTLALVLLLLGTGPAKAFTWFQRRLERRLAPGPGAGRSERESDGYGALARSAIAKALGSGSDRASGRLAAIVAFAGVSFTFAAIAVVELRQRAELDVGVLFLLQVTALVTLAFVTAGCDASRSWGLFAAFRSAWRTLLTQAPAALAIGALVLLVGSLRLRDITLAEVGPGGALGETGGLPWYWFAARAPQLVLLFSLSFSSLLIDATPRIAVESNGPKTIGKNPTPEPAEDESGLRRTAFSIGLWSSMFLSCGVAAALFLGGWYVPGYKPIEHDQSVGLQVAGTALFLLKSWGLVAIVAALRTALPRIKAAAIGKLALRVIAPLAVVFVAMTVAMAHYPLLPTVERMMSLLVLTSFSVVAISIVAGIGGRAKTVATNGRVNLFL